MFGPKVRHLGRPALVILFGLFIDGFVEWLIHTYVHDTKEAIAAGIAAHVFVGLGGVLVAVPAFVKLLPEIGMVWKYAVDVKAGTGGTKIKDAVIAFLRPRLQSHFHAVEEIFGKGLTIAEPELAPLTKAAFEGCSGPYVGIDANTPTRFRELYPDYLEYEVAGRRPKDIRTDTRYLALDQSVLLSNFQDDPEEFAWFCDFHQRHGISLLQVNAGDVKAAQHRAQLPSAELGLYGGEYAIFFDPQGEGKIKIALHRLDASLSKRLQLYLEVINRKASRIVIGNGKTLKFERLDTSEIQSQLRRMQVSKN